MYELILNAMYAEIKAVVLVVLALGFLLGAAVTMLVVTTARRHASLTKPTIQRIMAP